MHQNIMYTGIPVINVTSQQKFLTHSVTTKNTSTTKFIIRVMNVVIWRKVLVPFVHKKAKHQNILFNCHQCDHTAKDSKTLRYHKKNMHTNIMYNCDECDNVIKNSAAFRYHNKTKHQNILFNCDQCDYTAKDSKTLRYHKQNVHQKIIYNCDECDHLII